MSLPTVIANDFYLEVARGNVTGYTAREIAGMNAAVGGTEDIWDQGGSITQVATAALLYISSDAAGDITQTVTITGLDANYDEITETIALNGADGCTRVAGTKTFLRVNSAVLSAACTGNVYVYYLSDVTAGVPDDATKIQAKILATALQAYNAIYTVPRNKNLYLTGLHFRSTGSTTTHNVILSVIRKLYGGANVTVKTIKYLDPSSSYIDEQYQFTDQPVVFPAKSVFRVAAGLAGGTALEIALLANFIEESISVAPATTTVINQATYAALLTTRSQTLASQNYYLIGMDEVPTALPSSFNLDNLLATITGATNYRVAADTEVAFDPAYFVSGKLISTTKKALLTVMRCVDTAANVDYVLAPVNTVVDLGSGVKKTQKISYLA